MASEPNHIILRTRLHRPPVSAEHVYRSRLIEFLLKNQYKPLTLISAPAGYGKSMLASSWLEKCKYLASWVSLSKETNNLYTFLEYIHAGLTAIFPKALKTFSSLIKGPETLPVKVIAEALLNDLDEINEDFVLVLDDFHLISNASIHELINLVLKFPPQQMHLVILTRKDPPLSLGFLRVYNRMNELRMRDLAFTENETIDLYQKLINTSLNDEIAKLLNQKTEGWIVGLRMASISIKPTKDVENILANLHGDSLTISEFLLEQVLAEQPEEHLELLLIASILDRFSSELLAHIHQDESTKAFFQWLIKSDLFLIPLDNTNEWFRFHHLFKDLLFRQLKQKESSEKIKSYQTRASSWFEDHGFYEESIDHALMADNMSTALGMFYAHRYELMNSEQWNRLNNLTQLYPEDVSESDPLILTTRALYYDYRGSTESAFELLEQIDKLQTAVSNKTHEYQCICGEYYTLLSLQQFLILNDFELAIGSAKNALNVLPDDAQYVKTFALYWYALSLQMSGRTQESRKLISDALNDPLRFDSKTHARIYILRCSLYYLTGDLNESKEAANNCLHLGKKHKLQEAINLAYYFLGSIHYFRNELTEAVKYFELLFRNRYTNRLTYAVIGTAIQVLIYNAIGQAEEARSMITSLQKLVSDLSVPLCKEYYRALGTELALIQGDLPLAFQIDDQREYMVYAPLWFTFIPQLTSIKVLIVNQSSASSDLAEEKLKTMLVYGQSTQNTYVQIQVLALQALHFWKLGNEKNALDVLNESLSLASSGGYIRIYIEHGDAMKRIFSKIPDYQEPRDFINQILIAFDKEAAYTRTPSTKEQHKRLLATDDSLDIEPLSVREMDVLKLLAQGLRNKEIASGLHIATETVKVHLSKIFKKLRASSRIEAVNIAKTAGLLEDL